MKGVVLAGGLGSRLHPLTKITNKHLLPVYNEPMVYYPIRKLVEAGIRDILLVTGGQNAGDFLRLLGNGEDFGLRQFNYAYQVGEGGIAAALRLAEPPLGERLPGCSGKDSPVEKTAVNHDQPVHPGRVIRSEIGGHVAAPGMAHHGHFVQSDLVQQPSQVI